MGVDRSVELEGVLFYKAAPMKKRALCTLLAIEAAELDAAIAALESRLLSGATRIIVTDTEVELVTAPELDTLIEGLQKDEMKRDIGKAGAETLAIVLYRGPLSRAEIDRVRGVNSSFILRNLMTRGLIERTSGEKLNQYQATPELLAHLGITKRNDLPGFKETMDALDQYERNFAESV